MQLMVTNILISAHLYSVSKNSVMLFLRNIALDVINLNTQEHIPPTTSTAHTTSTTTSNNNKSSNLLWVSSWRMRISDYVIESGMTQLRDINVGLNSGLLCLRWVVHRLHGLATQEWFLNTDYTFIPSIFFFFFLLSYINIYSSIDQFEKCWVLLITL